MPGLAAALQHTHGLAAAADGSNPIERFSYALINTLAKAYAAERARTHLSRALQLKQQRHTALLDSLFAAGALPDPYGEVRHCHSCGNSCCGSAHACELPALMHRVRALVKCAPLAGGRQSPAGSRGFSDRGTRGAHCGDDRGAHAPHERRRGREGGGARSGPAGPRYAAKVCQQALPVYSARVSTGLLCIVSVAVIAPAPMFPTLL